MGPKVAVIYYSQTGITHDQARAVGQGAEEGGAEVRLRRVRELASEQQIAANEAWARHREETQDIPEATQEDLEWADAVVFGTPTRFGLPAAPLKLFIDQMGGLWAQGKLANKIAASFTSAGTEHGGQETTILALNNTFYHWGAIIVPPGYLDPVQFEAGNPYGASHTSNNGHMPPDAVALGSAHFLGRRVVEIAAKIRITEPVPVAG